MLWKVGASAGVKRAVSQAYGTQVLQILSAENSVLASWSLHESESALLISEGKTREDSS